MNLPMAPTLPVAPSASAASALPMAPSQAGAKALSPAEIAELQAEVRTLAAERRAVILAHNYQLPEVQDVADYVGDSLGLSRRAAAADDAETIVFCGVHFMAETASILCPEKTVLIPDLDAGCSLADSIDFDQLAAWKATYPEGVVVMYVNTTAAVKALTDYCCTSANAVEVVRHIYATHGSDAEILFGPDMWLGAYVEKQLGKRMHVWDGECHVHAGIRPADIAATRAAHPGADFLIHPECGCTTSIMEYVAAGDVSAEGVHMLSTGGMLAYAESAAASSASATASSASAAASPEGAAASPEGAAASPEGAAASPASPAASPEEDRDSREQAGHRRLDAGASGAPGRREVVVATEIGMLYPLQMAAPDVEFIPANAEASCKYMKMITLPKLRDALREMQFEVRVPEDIAVKARVPIDRMVALG